jgi:hypothetical protein
MAGVGGPLMAATGLAAVLSLAFRYRRARTTERAQLKWLVYAGVLIVAALLVSALATRIMGPGNAASNLENAMTSGAIALVPVAIGIAVLRYRLYDIDRVLSRTVAYAIVTGLLVGVYAGLVLLATQLLRVHTPVAVAASTLAAAALFNPVRWRVQKAVDRRFNRARYDMAGPTAGRRSLAPMVDAPPGRARRLHRWHPEQTCAGAVRRSRAPCEVRRRTPFLRRRSR